MTAGTMRFATTDWSAGHDDLDGVPPPAATLRLVGHASAFSDLFAAHRANRLGHAWLLEGPAGIGKACAAFAFARELSAPESRVSETEEPAYDADHPVVRQIANAAYPGLIHVTRPEANTVSGYRSEITVGEIRALARFFHATASGTGWRIAIVDPADDLNRNAANALLKLLEEPPARSIFLLVSHAPGRLLPTIRSRCRVLRFSPLAVPDVRRALSGITHGTSNEDLEAAAAASEGSVRAALVNATSGGGEIASAVDAILRAGRPDWARIQAGADSVTARGRDGAYQLFAETVLTRLAREAEEEAEKGDLAAAARLAGLWQRETVRLREAAAFNLDRKQSLLTLFANIFDARRAGRGLDERGD